jgi:hypothetical protein
VKIVVHGLAFLFLFMMNFPARSEVIVDNLDGVRATAGRSAPYATTADTYDARAQRFTLGDGRSFRLTSVTVALRYSGGGSNSVTVTLWSTRRLIYSALYAGQYVPSRPLATIGTRSFNQGVGITEYATFTNFDGIILEGGSYWIVVQQARPEINSIEWSRVNLQLTRDYHETGTGGIVGWASGNVSENSWYLQNPPKIVGLFAVEGEPIATPMPRVNVQMSGDSLSVSWPGTASEFRLESATSLGPGAVWTAEPLAAMWEEEFSYTEARSSGPKYFRLKR